MTTPKVMLAVRWLVYAIPLGVMAVFAANVQAHESRPAYLEINEIAPDRYSLLWRTPVLSGQRLPVELKLPDGFRNIADPTLKELSDSLIERRIVEADHGLAGKRVEFFGLQATITDVLVRVKRLDGTLATTLVRPSQPWVEFGAPEGTFSVARAYLLHGIEHILFGFDHLLFVLALILIVQSGRVLLFTITAFTLAHSITLTLATLGVVNVPGPPVEATIALSILLLASEITRLRQGEPSLTAKWPWLVAFCFGLLHGFGFAGALTAIGLPPAEVPLALFAFNVGVELGQLLFVAVVLAAMACARWFEFPSVVERRVLTTTVYGIGILSAFWFFQRLAGFA